MPSVGARGSNCQTVTPCWASRLIQARADAPNVPQAGVPGNAVAGSCIAGEKYTFRYQFSPVFPRRPGNLPITSGRTQLRTMVVNYRDSGFFRTEVAPYGSDPVTEAIIPAKLAQFSGKVLGDEDLILNAPAFHTGDYRFQVYGRADTATVALVNDTHVPSIFIGAEWEALYWNRASA